MRTHTIIRESDLDADFEYNFDVTPFDYIINGIHWLVTTPFHSAAQLVKVVSAQRSNTGSKRVNHNSFSGPYCMLK